MLVWVLPGRKPSYARILQGLNMLTNVRPFQCSQGNVTVWTHKLHMSCLMTKPMKWHMRPVKTQISVGICPVLLESLLPHEESLCPLPNERTAKIQIRLGECPGWSESSQGAHAISLVLSWGSSYVLCISPLKWLWKLDILKSLFIFSSLILIPMTSKNKPGSVGQSAVFLQIQRLWLQAQALPHNFMEIDHEKITAWHADGDGFDPFVREHSFCGDWSLNHFCGHFLPTADSSRAVVSYWRKDVHLVLVNCLGSLPRNSVVRLTDCLYMTIVVDWGIKPEINQTIILPWNNFYGHSPPSTDSNKAVVSYWQKFMHLVLVNCLGGLSLPRNTGSKWP